MKCTLFFILLFVGYISAQQVEPLVHDTASDGTYHSPNDLKVLGTKNDATHHRIPVDIGGASITISGAGLATAIRQDTLLLVVKNLRTALANLTNGSQRAVLLDSTGHYLGSIAHPIYIQPHDSVTVKYEKPTYQAIIAGNAAQATGVRQDTLLAVVKNLRTALANLTNGTLLTTPYLKHNTIIDSIAHTGGARVDTVWFHPAGLYGITYLFFAGRSDKPDTLSVAFRSAASRLVWGSNAVYLTDQTDKSIPSDITTLIIPQSLHKRYLISVVNCEWVRVYRKTTNSVNRVKTVLVGLEENNL